MRSIAVCLLLAALSGCSGLTPTGQLATEYAKAARQLGVNPVYPPREEFQVGDVFLVSVEKDDTTNSVSVWLGSSDEVRAAAESFLKTRVVFAATGTADPEVPTPPKDGVSQQDLFSPEIATRADERILSLPVAAFPSITMQAGSTTSTGLVAAVAALGFGATEQTTVTLDFNDVRSYWIPQVLAIDKQDEALNIIADHVAEGALEIPHLVKTKEYNEGKKSKDRCLRAAVVTRVYLTRQINYTYRDRQIVAAGIKFASEGKNLSSVQTAPNINVQVLNSTDAAGTDLAQTAALAEDVRKAVVSSTQATTEGGSFSFVDWNARGITFKQKYQRPVAVGWEGFMFDLPEPSYGTLKSCSADYL